MDTDNPCESSLSLATHDEAMVKTGQDQLSTDRKGKKQVTFDDGVQLFTYIEPGYFDKSWKRMEAKGGSDKGITVDELNKLTIFSSHNWPHISTSRPRLTSRVASKPA